MKKALKYSLLLIITIFITFTTSGCTDDNMDNIDIYVTNYANEYITKELYGEHATVTSIYPDGIDINKYKVSKKQKETYSKSDLFIYNGLIEKERDMAVDLLSLNPELKIIDSSDVLETDYSPEELWLNPSSLLMMAQNIRIGLEEYATSKYLIDDIDEQYEKLKITLSELDANYRITVENTTNKNIVVDNSALKYLEKFGLKVYCIDGDATDKTISDVEELIENKEINYIYSFKNDTLSDNAKKILEDYPDIKNQQLHRLDNISDTERSEKKDYEQIITENLELLKQELYQ
ncbi:MAG: metal ABC transporter substrate-binding protein [Bacilli bacterium]|nr:metal ABC transporter substrate-binding protein [bacterium]MDY5992814.1 metal ABC transporter substrate-binding protein [Bacilli bacterium]MEE0015318.1 metal ABC transporter substrate-binding protein [Bacilli bacterium]